ncbi:helix-turn-helix transcriptional regulator [Paraglaciecola sp. MB-3u-78]|uniref:helix-turn-helix domain-containing protein n=1 Tax=Paraglaciecola sp. MB-3u-78 TaxID=2058332 RepID=UPI0021063AE8|nr:helix-turn-helix transcriptional regulator [Paraglaciecola sp. MB-3u-78]
MLDVVRDTGINRSTANRLYHESTSSIDFETLEKLCDYLESDVGEWLETIK